MLPPANNVIVSKKTKILCDEQLFKWEHFTLMGEIGEGKFARVYKASSTKDNKNVALRVLKASEAAAINKRKLQREAKELLSLNHKNIIKCYGIILEKSTFVLEYCEAVIFDDGKINRLHTLLGLLQLMEDDIPIEVRNNAIKGVANGLTYLHSRNMTAGDLKPSNVLLSQEDNGEIVFKLSDLSLNSNINKYSLMSTSLSMTTSEMVFTLLYVAPELMSVEYCIQAKPEFCNRHLCFFYINLPNSFS